MPAVAYVGWDLHAAYYVREVGRRRPAAGSRSGSLLIWDSVLRARDSRPRAPTAAVRQRSYCAHGRTRPVQRLGMRCTSSGRLERGLAGSVSRSRATSTGRWPGWDRALPG